MSVDAGPDHLQIAISERRREAMSTPTSELNPEALEKAFQAIDFTRPMGWPQLESIIRAYLSALPAEQKQEGWKMVPIESTREMYEAGIAAFQNPANRHGAILDEVYAAYLAAAPEPKP